MLTAVRLEFEVFMKEEWNLTTINSVTIFHTSETIQNKLQLQFFKIHKNSHVKFYADRNGC